MNIAASSDKLSMALTPVRVAEDAVEIAIEQSEQAAMEYLAAMEKTT